MLGARCTARRFRVPRMGLCLPKWPRLVYLERICLFFRLSMTPEAFIQSIRLLFGEYPANSGGCKQFAELLQALFGGELYYNNDHFITLIEGQFYDIRGSYTDRDLVRYIYEGRLIEFPISDFLPAAEFGPAHTEAAFNSSASSYP